MTVGLGPTLFSARPLAEYRAMFALTEVDLSGQGAGLPGRPVAVDVVYERAPAEVAVLARDEAERGNAYMAGNADRYVWSYFPHRATSPVARVWAGA